MNVMTSLDMPVPFQDVNTELTVVAEKLKALNGTGQFRVCRFTVTVPAVGAVKESTVDSEPATRVVLAMRMLSAHAWGASTTPDRARGASSAAFDSKRLVFISFILSSFREFLWLCSRGEPQVGLPRDV